MKISLRPVLLGGFILTGLITLAGFYLNALADRWIDNLKQDSYEEMADSMRLGVEANIREKQSSILSIGVSIARSDYLINFLAGKGPAPDLKELSHTLGETTEFKNLWFHIVDKNGVSRYRTWTDKRGDSLLEKRLDVVEMIRNPAVRNTISTGIFSMTFKSLIPVFDKHKNFLGSFEVIAHFNSIIRSLNSKGVEAVILVDPSYKHQLSKSLTKTFIQDYYLINPELDANLLSTINRMGLDMLVRMDDYLLTPDYLVTLYRLPDLEGNPMGYFLLFKQLSDLNFTNIESFRNILKISVTLGFILVVSVMLLFHFWRSSRQTKSINHRLEKMVKLRTAELLELNRNLEERVRQAVDQQRQQEQFLIQQNKLASMSEMLTNISHHWRQPLNVLALNIQDIGDAYHFGELNEKYLDEVITLSMEQIHYMSKTIDSFKNFFTHSAEKEPYHLNDAIDHVMTLLYPEMEAAKISLVRPDTDVTIIGYESELRQVLLNVLTNAMEAIVRAQVSNGRITIGVRTTKTHAVISVEDNAGGIDQTIMDKIFDPYFTTKFKSKGVGLSLYMSKIIVEKSMDGSLEAENAPGGARFVLTLPLK